MKAARALIAWTPAGANPPFSATAGTVKVGPLIKRGSADWAKPYLYTGGAAWMVVRNLIGDAAVAQVFITFNEIVVRDKVPVEDAHEAFLEIDEYASRLAPDIRGSTADQD